MDEKTLQAKLDTIDPKEHKLTWRALIAGFLLSIGMCAMNSVLTLKLGIIEEGPTIAAILFFCIFVFFGKKILISELAIVATMGSAGGSLGFIANFFAAHVMLGNPFSFWEMTAFGICSSLIGMIMVIFLRQILIINEKMPWPSPVAVREVILSLAGSTTKMHTYLLFGAITLMGTYYVLSDIGFVPFMPALPVAAIAAYGATIALSPFALGGGGLIGVRAGFGFLVGGIALLIMAPYLTPGVDVEKLSKPHTFYWPGVALLTTAGLTQLIWNWRTTLRALKSIFIFKQGEGDPVIPPKVFLVFSVMAIILTVALLYFVFKLALVLILLMLVLGGYVQNMIAVRNSAETAFTPSRVFGVLLILLCVPFGGGTAAYMTGAGFVAGSGSQASTLTADLVYGRWLKIKPNWQFWVQMSVIIPTCFVAAGVFMLIQNQYSITMEGGDLAAPVAKTWAAVANLFSPESGKTLSSTAVIGLLAGGGAGIVLCLLDQVKKIRKYLPHHVGIGVALVLPFGYDLSFFLGAILLCWLLPKVLKISETTALVLAAAGIVAEGGGSIFSGLFQLAVDYFGYVFLV